MRNNLIFKGILEVANETWEQTKTAVSNLLANKLENNRDTNSIEDRIERAHRGGKKTIGQPRPIFVKCYCH